MARLKNLESFCSFCGTITKMEISGDYPGSETKKWVRCRKCKQKMVVDLAEQQKEDAGLDTDQFTVYAPSKSFTVGESIYHQTWDDYGRVVSKELLSDGKSAITVEFRKLGSKKLIESITL